MGQFLAQAADGLAQAAFADTLVLQPFDEGTPGRILALFALTLLPYSAISPFMGVFVDRWQRRSLLVWTNVVRGVFLVTLPLWANVLPGNVGLYAGVFVLLGFGRLFLTTKGALLPAVLHEHHLLRGNSLSSGGGMIAALAGGVAGVGAVYSIGPRPSFALSGLLYGGAALLLRSLSDPYAHPHARAEGIMQAVGRVAGELAEGIGVITNQVRAWLPLIAIFLLRTAGMFVAIAAILVIKNEFPDTGDRFGRLSSSALALGAAGVGAFVGALSALAFGRRFTKPQLVLLGFVISGAGIVALGGIESIPAVLGLTFVGGFGGFIAKVSVDAQVQEALPDEYRGRAFALYDLLYNLASVAAAAFMFVFQKTDLRPLLAIGGVVTLLLAAVFAMVMSRNGMLARGTIAPADL